VYLPVKGALAVHQILARWLDSIERMDNSLMPMTEWPQSEHPCAEERVFTNMNYEGEARTNAAMPSDPTESENIPSS
jgi:hypothetical protein